MGCHFSCGNVSHERLSCDSPPEGITAAESSQLSSAMLLILKIHVSEDMSVPSSRPTCPCRRAASSVFLMLRLHYSSPASFHGLFNFRRVNPCVSTTHFLSPEPADDIGLCWEKPNCGCGRGGDHKFLWLILRADEACILVSGYSCHLCPQISGGLHTNAKLQVLTLGSGRYELTQSVSL